MIWVVFGVIGIIVLFFVALALSMISKDSVKCDCGDWAELVNITKENDREVYHYKCSKCGWRYKI